MNDLGKLIGAVEGQGSGGAAGPAQLGTALQELVGGEGNLQALVEKLRTSGIGDQLSSWVGSGENQPVTAVQLQQALGEARVQQLATKTGLSVDQLLPMLAGILPAIVDALTPGGTVPSGDALRGADLGGLLAGLTGAGHTLPTATTGGIEGAVGGAIEGEVGKLLGGKG